MLANLYNRYLPLVPGGRFGKYPIQNNINQLNEFNDNLSDLFRNVNVDQSLATHLQNLTTMLNTPLIIMKDPNCEQNTRALIRELKDCYVDIRTIKLEQLKEALNRYLPNPNEYDLQIIQTILNDFIVSLMNEIIIRDYDAFIYQATGNQADTPHLNFRNRLYLLLPNLQILSDQFQPGGLISSDLVNLVLNDMTDFDNSNTHGNLINPTAQLNPINQLIYDLRFLEPKEVVQQLADRYNVTFDKAAIAYDPENPPSPDEF